MGTKNFILVQDVETAKLLKSMGLKSIPSNNNVFIFINNDEIKVNFDLVDKSKICYSNKITI